MEKNGMHPAVVQISDGSTIANLEEANVKIILNADDGILFEIMINGIDNVEIRCFIQKGETINVNAFISDFGRIFNNFLDMTKV